MSDLKNSGNKLLHGKEKKFGLFVVTIVFLLLFAIGAFLLSDRNRALQERQQLVEETKQLTELVEKLQSQVSINALEEIDFEQFQTMTLDNGELYVGQAAHDEEKNIVLNNSFKLDESNQISKSNESVKVSQEQVKSLRNVSKDSFLIRMLGVK